MKKNIKKISMLGFFIIIIVIISLFIKFNTGIILTQLSSEGPRQMMGYIIKNSNDKIIVIDGGTPDESEKLLNYIKNNGGEVDAWYITHPHIDHMGAFLDIIENFKEQISIKKIYVTINDITWYEKYSSEDRTKEVKKFIEMINTLDNVEEVQIADIHKYDNIKMEILGVKNPEIINNNINNSSMILKLYVNDKDILFLADTGEESGEKFLKNMTETKIKSYMVQMAHHGQRGVKEEVYKIVNPIYCLWPCPNWLYFNESGDFKTDETKEWMGKLNVKKDFIANEGDISIKVW